MKSITMMTAAALFAATLLAAPALAQSQHQGGSAHGHKAASTDAPSVKEFKAAHEKMMRDMDVPYTGNAEADFARGMIPHHQGAIDMAKIYLKYGKDKDLRTMAENIIRDQEKEIAQLQDSLKKATK